MDLYYRWFKKIYGKKPLNQDTINESLIEKNNGTSRAFLKLLLQFYQIEDIKIEPRKGRARKPLTRYITKEQFTKLISGLPPENKLLLMLTYEGALRASDAVNLTDNDIDFDNNRLRGWGKGRKEFRVNFSERSKDLMHDLLEEERFDNPKPERLFPFTRQRADQIIRRASIENLGFPISMHVLRHSMATHLLRQGKNLKVIQKYLRHADVSTTSRYTHITDEDTEDEIKLVLENG